MFVLGTAGHVDHGKSTLVKALTGIDPDRWAEEQRRQMTIDLGFAWLDLPGGRQISLVDVPGHERFIKNMLAGVGGIHGVLLIVAADESIMPQTREHIAILDLLEMRHGIVVVTKCDLVDPEWLSLVHDEIRDALAATFLAAAPHVAVSARTGAGLDQLRSDLTTLVQTIAPAGAAGRGPRLSIDRSFTIGGFGTVVTGTLVDGPLHVGDEVEILPSTLRARVRGLQTRQQSVDTVAPGQRVAVNLSGIHHRQIRRGDLLALPAALQPTELVDVQLRLAADAPPLHQNDALDLFVGAAEARCRVTLLDSDELRPGSVGWAQLRLNAPLALVAGDRIILRVPSPSQTVAGGRIIDPHPVRHRRFRAEVIEALTARARGEPSDLLLAALTTEQPIAWSALRQAAGLPDDLALTARHALAAAGRLTVLAGDTDDAHVIEADRLAQLRTAAAAAVDGYHRRWPLRRGMPREELRRRLKLSARQMIALLPALRETLDTDELSVRRSGFTPQPDTVTRAAVDRYLREARQTPFAAPTPALDDEVRNWMLDTQLVVRLAEDAYLLPQDYHACRDWIIQRLRSGLTVSVAEVRDRFATSRRYALALLEHLDELRITRRTGDTRVAGDALR